MEISSATPAAISAKVISSVIDPNMEDENCRRYRNTSCCKPNPAPSSVRMPVASSNMPTIRHAASESASYRGIRFCFAVLPVRFVLPFFLLCAISASYHFSICNTRERKGRCPLTLPKGLRPSGLPFSRLSCAHLHTASACLCGGFAPAEAKLPPASQKRSFGRESIALPILRQHQHHRPQDTILIRVQTQRRIAPPRIIIRLPRA